MHRSALAAICVHVPHEVAAEENAFWATALGRPSRQGTSHPEYDVLEARPGEVADCVPRVGNCAARVHLDVHTDDVERRRLVAAGATESTRHGDWAVLEDPADRALCVVPVAHDDPLLDGAPSWPSGP